MLDPVSNKVDFPRVEADVLAFWKDRNIFQRSIDERPADRAFVFYDGPPFATGLPHYGHILAGTIKDVVPRYKTMRGYRVSRRFGWDCHGLPVENEMEKQLQISGKKAIEAYGIHEFNEACRSIVLRYAGEWETIIGKTGRWVDFKNDYKTMDLDYMESIFWVFKSIWDKGLIYEGKRSMPICPRCSTPLSNFEVLQGYKEVKDPAITVKFPVVGSPNTFILAWTTTPWTLPSNLALTVGPEIDYVRVKRGDETFVCAAARAAALFGTEPDHEIVATLKGKDLVGMRYEPLFPYFAGLAAEGAFRVIDGDFVTTEDGTGVVHTAPGFGEDDFVAGQKHGLPLVCPMDMEGKFTSEVADYAGQNVKDADPKIVERLKSSGLLFAKTTILHNYPHCWRCESPLYYRAITTWFLKIDPLKEAMLAANAQTTWVPANLRDGRFGNWLAGARDWAISRNRYWGAPLPVWRCETCGKLQCVGSIRELETLSGQEVTDLHKHFTDKIELPCSEKGCDGRAKRIPEVLDCWFESGSMPYAQVHYPFENKDWFEANFPADFIAEGLDQTRGWFYSLTVIGTALFGKSPFKNVVVNGMVLAEDGKKMSKRLKNYPEPMEIVSTMGADAMRLALMDSPVVRAEELRFSEAAVDQELKNILIPLWNSYAFFVSYARTDGFDPERDLVAEASPNPLDRWIVSRLNGLVGEVIESMDRYDLQGAVGAFVRFIDELTNWYIRRSRRRFWKSENDGDKRFAHSTLYRVLKDLVHVIAPYVPFVAEAIYRNLRTEADPESVHLALFPVVKPDEIDRALDRHMDRAIRAASMGRALRVKHNLKVRQPLPALLLVTTDAAEAKALAELSPLIRDELNVKEVRFTDNEDDLVVVSAKGNFRVLGARLGKDTPKIAAAVATLTSADIRALQRGEKRTVTAQGASAEVTIDDLQIARQQREGLVVENDGTLTVALETTLTPELLAEGHAREFTSKIQGLRKDMDLEITDRIRVTYSSGAELAQAIEAYRDHIMNEILATELVYMASGQATEIDVNGFVCRVAIEK